MGKKITKVTKLSKGKNAKKNLKTNQNSKSSKKPAALPLPSKTKPVKKSKTVVKAKAAPPKKAKAPKIRKQLPKKVAKKPSGPLGYTQTEYEKFKTYKKKYNEYSNQALKDLLKKNLQSMSGNKDDLVYKCADGATLGRIPRCPTCFGGRPKFNHLTGTYHCSGYHDDADFKNCHTNYNKGDLTRDPWTD